MVYPGDDSLDPTVQQRVLTAFAEAVRLHREGHSEESRTILRSIAEVDPRFAPAQRLEQAIAAGSPVDLGQLIGEVTAHTGMDIEGELVKAHQAFAQRDFQGALARAQLVLRELPGHTEARQLALEAQARVRATGEIQTHITRVRDALDAGLTEEARGFLRLAKDIDPTNPEVAVLERRLELAAKPPATEAEPEFEFEVFDHLSGVAASPALPMPAPAPLPQPAAARPSGGPVVETPAAAASQSHAAAPPPPAPAEAAPPPPAPAEAAPPPPAPAAGTPPRTVGGMQFDEAGGGSAMEFHPGFGEDFGAEPEVASEPEETAVRIQALLDQGQDEFDRGDFQSAIDSWSRIYLIDAQYLEAERRIGQARRRRAELDRLAEQHFYEAREAFEQKRLGDARALCQQVLKLQPQHLEAHDLLQRLETPAAPPPPPSAPALAGEDDLFRDEFVPATLAASAGGAAIPSMGPGAVPSREPGRAARAPRAKMQMPSIPLPLLGIGVAVVVLLLVAGFLLRGKMFSGGGAVAEALVESEQLARQGQLQEAVQLLQSLQGQAEGEQANQVNQRVLEYQRRLKAKAAPQPVADSKIVADALASGRRVKAMRLLRDGLAKIPGDPDLLKLQSEITSYSPTIPALADAIGNRGWEAIRNLAGQVLKEQPDDPEAQQIWAVATFNGAILQLRKYQVAQGHDLLVELAKRNPDPEIIRLEELAKSYLSRPADPRYQIFVTNVELRTLE
jgi:tetratricopeptide (TPR) repeat protein